jgi:hypothetical protein
MAEKSQLTTAMMALVFLAALLVSSQLFIEYRSSNSFNAPAVAEATFRAAKIPQIGIPLPL